MPDHAIVVGITKYPGINDLEGPENDARWFHDWLIRHELVAKKDATLIVSSDFKPAKATAALARHALPSTAAVDLAFEQLLAVGGEDGVIGNRLYLFFSGHGFAQTLDEAALLMSNCDLQTGATGHHVNAVRYADFFAMSAYFSEVVLFMDCCRDDLVRIPPRLPPWQSIREVDGSTVKRFYGLATRWSQKAREGKTTNGTVHGHFTRALIAALEGGAVNPRGELSTANVIDFTTNYVQSVIGPELDAKGIPRAEPVFTQKDPFLLATGQPFSAATIEIRFGAATAPAGCSVVGGNPLTNRTNVTGQNPWTFQLGVGKYAVLRPDGQTQAAQFDVFGEPLVINV